MHSDQCVENLDPYGVILPVNAPNRIPIAAPDDIGANYHDDYDQKTLFYDCYRTLSNDYLELLGPPLLNLRPLVRGIYLGDRAAKTILIARRKLERLQILDPMRGVGETSLAIDLGPFGMRRVPIHPRETGFDGRQVLLTMFRYEPISWVIDWVCYHVDVHGVDAVLIYANFVNRDLLKELCRRLDGIGGLIHFAVVSWNYPYGPVKDAAFTPDIPRESPRRWSSCFCQTGMFEHARLRFLGRARAVLNLDVDELAVTEDGSSIFSLLEELLAPVIILREKRVGGRPEELATPLTKRRHRHFNRLLPDREVPAAKWLLAPDHLEDEAQWMTHQVRSTQAAEATPRAWYAHFSPLNMGWNYSDRSRLCVVRNASPSLPLSKAFARVGWSK